MGRKIATCCYCGTRAVLVFDETLHELTCRACGAPLHDMKMMPQSPRAQDVRQKKAPVDRRTGRPVAEKPEWHGGADPRRRKKKSNKRRKPMFGRLLEEVWDVVEDIID
ncbi:hypothetical protein [Roseovarius sp.]|uniref:hypothetical protein n=1 Tax=Roseovarius sp. TaxID=1486281 RepID=UPI003D0D65DB